jgi:drug/metabolite transporter (DMT)-like permease
MQSNRMWLVYALVTTVAWGIWGAFINVPATSEGPGDPVLPPTLGYIVWALTMIPPAAVGLYLIRGRLDHRPRDILFGMSIGLLGAAGQLVLFPTLSLAPAHLVFGIVALSPVITIFLAFMLAGERAHPLAALGVVVALVAGVLLSQDVEWFSLAKEAIPNETAAIDGGTLQETLQSPLWIFLSLLVFAAWGIQGYLFSSANRSMQAESIFFYMMVSGLLLAPIAWLMTDFEQSIDWGWSGPALAAAIHLLNSVGALLIVFAFRYGKAMLVSPLTNAGAPAITIALSLMLGSAMPTTLQKVGLVLAVIAAALMAIESEQGPASASTTNPTG